uniref:Plastid lipid-associated protein/fibrillin conserved domain-containing protein n=1 Tax=Aegilops tauschii TaxID=37682 RepID=M8BST7_AEGTA
MERLSAKESLLLAVSRLPLSCSPSSQNEWPRPAPYCRAGPYESWVLHSRPEYLNCCPFQFRDSGGFESFVSGKTTEMQKIDVNERIVGLERLNPTPRPTTSPYLEGRWNIEWFGDSSPGTFASKLLFERSPTSVAHFTGLDVVIRDGYCKISSNVKLLNTIQNRFVLTTQLSVEGPIRMKEEYVEAFLETPKISEETLPEQLKGLLGQTAGALQQLPASIRDAVSEGVKLPLNGMYQRLFMISYLDEEILIIRDAAGAPDVLTKLEGPQPNPMENTPDVVIPEYQS